MTAPISLDAAFADRERVQKLLTFNRTDAGNAEAFAFLYGRLFRFDHSRHKWLVWNGRYWEQDETGEADRSALNTARELLRAAMQITDPDNRKDAVGWALRSESTYARRAMLSSAETIKTLATTATSYDRDSFLLTVGNATLNLRTGVPQPFNPNDLITRATDVPYYPEATCPRWEQVLDEIFGADARMISFAQRAVGYSLTGAVTEHCFFMLYGGGANGKSTFLEVILKLVGSYGAITSFSSFLIHQNPANPRNDIARLHGARLVKAAESQKQAALDEATVKEVTGGDTISARFLFKEFFQFQPQFKLWLATNHRPTIHGTDDAIWRRIRLIPFNQQFTGATRDPKLREKLEAELPGILAWAMHGCHEWQRVGLGSAPVVEKATLSYRQESDLYGRFLTERCTSRQVDQVSGKELFDAYLEWCARTGEKAESNNAFAQALAERGIKKKRTSKGTVYVAVGLRPEVKVATVTNEQSRRGGGV